jgi:hypothetical protein
MLLAGPAAGKLFVDFDIVVSQTEVITLLTKHSGAGIPGLI